MTEKLNNIQSTAEFNEKANSYHESAGNPFNFKKKQINSNPTGLYNNPYYQKREHKEQNEELENRFFVKKDAKKQKTQTLKKKKKNMMNDQQCYQAG